MRILFVGANRTLVGGGESYQRAAMTVLIARGHAVGLLYERRPHPGPLPLDVDVAGVETWGIEEMGAEPALRRAADWKPDVAYVHGVASPTIEAGVLARWPAVLFAHGYYGTCATGTKRHAFPRLEACVRPFGPACLWYHYPRRCGGLNPFTMFSLYRRQAQRHRILKRYCAILVASGHMREEFRRHDLPSEQIHLLPLPPAGIERLTEPPPWKHPTGRLVALGRLTPLKGVAVLIDAMAMARNELPWPLTLTAIGEGSDRETLERRAAGRGVDVRFAGWVEAARRNILLRDADLMVLPSIWPEPWGLVGLEAACLGVPTVAFAWGGIPEWLRSGESGELAPADPPSAAGLAQAIIRALHDPAHYRCLSRGAWEQAARYSMEQHVTNLLAVLAAAVR